METLSLISIYCGGLLTFFMGIFHTQFFKIFKWEKVFNNISVIDKNIFYTLNIALLLLFFGIASVSLIYAEDLSSASGPALGIILINSLFWLWRTIWQILYFTPDKKSKRLYLHYILILYFSLLFITYTLPVVLKIISNC
jgi:hypothetical protein